MKGHVRREGERRRWNEMTMGMSRALEYAFCVFYTDM